MSTGSPPEKSGWPRCTTPLFVSRFRLRTAASSQRTDFFPRSYWVNQNVHIAIVAFPLSLADRQSCQRSKAYTARSGTSRCCTDQRSVLATTSWARTTRDCTLTDRSCFDASESCCPSFQWKQSRSARRRKRSIMGLPGLTSRLRSLEGIARRHDHEIRSLTAWSIHG